MSPRVSNTPLGVLLAIVGVLVLAVTSLYD